MIPPRIEQRGVDLDKQVIRKAVVYVKRRNQRGFRSQTLQPGNRRADREPDTAERQQPDGSLRVRVRLSKERDCFGRRHCRRSQELLERVMLVTEHRERHIREHQMDGTSLHVRRDGLLGYKQFRKRCATSREADVWLKRFDVYWKIERQGEGHGRVATAGVWIIRCAFCKEQLQFIELDRLDNIEHPLVRKNSLNNEALDSLV